MILTITLIALGFILFLIAGALRGLFECVLLFDSVDDWFGPYWAFTYFKSDKDRNKDGKISFWENHFPNDGGHRAKLIENFMVALGTPLLVLGLTRLEYNAWLNLALPFILWETLSIGFLLTFNKYRYLPKA